MCAYKKLRCIFTLSIYILVSISIKQIWKDTGNSQHKIPLGTRMFRICDLEWVTFLERYCFFNNLFICLGLCWVFVAAWSFLQWQSVGFSLRCLLLLLSMASRGVVFQWLPSCGSQALEHRLSICGTLAYLFRGV